MTQDQTRPDPGEDALRRLLRPDASLAAEHTPDSGMPERLQSRLLAAARACDATCYNHPPLTESEEGSAMDLQACHACGAQFDITPFEAGQEFSCGACGAVLIAGSPKGGRKPGASRRSPPGRAAPRAGKAKAGGRQYTPVKREGGKRERGGKAAAPSRPSSRAATRKTAARKTANRGDTSRSAPAKGPSPMLLASILGVAVLGVGALFFLGGDGDDNKGAGGTKAASSGGSQDASRGGAGDAGAGAGGGTAVAPAPTETAQEIMGEYGVNPPKTGKAWKGYISRLRALGDTPEGKQALTNVYEAFVKTIDGKDDVEAHRFLGHDEFTLTGEEESSLEGIALQDLDYVRGVRHALNKRWFSADEKDDWETAQKAKADMLAHIDRLDTDPAFAAGLQIRGNISRHKLFKDYNYVAHWASPFLICYSSSERVSEFDLLEIEDPAERKERRAELASKRRRYMKTVEEKGKFLQQLYKQYLKVFGERLGFKEIMGKYGGRPDYPPGVRTFHNGCPMTVWVFDNKQSWDKYHKEVAKELIPHFAAGYFSPSSGVGHALRRRPRRPQPSIRDRQDRPRGCAPDRALVQPSARKLAQACELPGLHQRGDCRVAGCREVRQGAQP